MEATALDTTSQLQPTTHASHTMDTEMDIDMDLDLGPEPDFEAIQLEIEPTPTQNGALEDRDILVTNEEPQFEKVHIRGVDELTTDDIKRFAAEHYQTDEIPRVEWIDDTSANVIYSTSEVGLQALAALTQQTVEETADSALPSLRLRTAKTLSTHPDSVLQVRSAVKTDRKQRRAHEASRFYMMHPEHDPRERMRREFAGGRRRGRRETSNGDYNRRRFDDREHTRRKDRAGADFDESMYDDNAELSRGSSRDARRGRREVSNDLFAGHSERSDGRLRDRSASPSRGDMDNNSNFQRASSRRFRDRSPRHGGERKSRSRTNVGKELFASTNASSDDGSGRRELFPNKTAASYLKKELFPTKSAISNHRRSDAFDAANETADLFAKRMTIPLMDGASDTPPQSGTDTMNVELFPDPPAARARRGLKIRGTSDDPGLSIRGSAASLNNGISIKGTASVRELFPSKYTAGGNEGKELFSDKLQGRGGRRRKAEDMFH